MDRWMDGLVSVCVGGAIDDDRWINAQQETETNGICSQQEAENSSLHYLKSRCISKCQQAVLAQQSQLYQQQNNGYYKNKESQSFSCLFLMCNKKQTFIYCVLLLECYCNATSIVISTQTTIQS